MPNTAMKSLRHVVCMARNHRCMSLEALAKSFGQKAVTNIYAADDFDSLLVRDNYMHKKCYNHRMYQQ